MARFALLFLAALWPALVTGGALWFADIAPYVRGGFVAVETVLSVADAQGADRGVGAADAVAGAEASGGGLAGRAPAAVSGARSVAYSLFAYLTGIAAPRFLVLVFLQGAVLAGLVSILAGREGGPVWLWAGLVALGAGALGASAAGPDVWAGLLVLAARIRVR